MGQGASSRQTLTAEPYHNTITQLNQSLFEVHKPKDRPRMVVVFFHGFQDGDYENAHWSTWRTEDGREDGSSTWLQTWLVWLVDDDQYPDALILSVAYSASLMKRSQAGSFDLYIIAENILSDLRDAKIAQEPHCPVVLVGHSFGGLIVKELCVQAHKGRSKHKTFLENIKGAFFYSTPHRGISREISEYFVSKANGPLLEIVKVLSAPESRLHEDFEKIRKQYDWQTAGVGEGSVTHLSSMKAQVIRAAGVSFRTSKSKVLAAIYLEDPKIKSVSRLLEGSSRYGDHFAIVPEANHFSICKPISKKLRAFTSLSNFLREVSSTCKRPECSHNYQSLPKTKTGIDNVLKELKQKLETVTSLGLAGMGGIGKTTMAKALFNEIEHLYECTCFVVDVKNSKEEVEKITLDHMHHMGKTLTKKDGGLFFLKGKELLLVLDDVASEKHITLLSTLFDDIGVHKNSRFLVTSRDSELLGQCLEAVHPMPFLSQDDARKLFLAHAIRQEASPSFEEHIDIIVEMCGGLALTLEVIGKHLYKKPTAIWKEAIRILGRADTVRGFEEKLWSKLRISFNGLDPKEKQMFLDCATVFRGALLREAKAAWNITTNGLQETLWQHLLDLLLVWEICGPRDDVLCGMHEQLSSLGRKIASNDAEYGLRICDLDVGLCLLSAKDCSENDVKDIVAIKVDGGLSTYRLEAFNLDYTEDIPNRTLPETLTTVKLTTTFHHNIVCDGCDMYPIEGPRFKSRVQTDYDLCVGCFEKGGHRKDEYFRLEPSVNVPLMEGSTLCKMKNLRHLQMSRFAIDQTHGATLPSTLVSLRMHMVQFSEFPFRPSDHERMAVLDITDCPELRTLPTTFGRLSSLHGLRISMAPYLKSLPDSLGSLRKLAYLFLGQCDSLAELPQTFVQLVALETFVIWRCGSLSALPKSLGHLPKLKALTIYGCPRLHNLPDTFLELQGLERLMLSWTYLQSIPNLENLRSLKSLYIYQDAPRIEIRSLSDYRVGRLIVKHVRLRRKLVMEKVGLLQ